MKNEVSLPLSMCTALPTVFLTPVLKTNIKLIEFCNSENFWLNIKIDFLL